MRASFGMTKKITFVVPSNAKDLFFISACMKFLIFMQKAYTMSV